MVLPLLNVTTCSKDTTKKWKWMRNRERMLPVSDLTVFAKMLLCHQMPMKSQEMINSLLFHYFEYCFQMVILVAVMDWITPLDVRRNMARYVLSNSKPFGLLPKTLPHSANFSLRSREIWNFKLQHSLIKIKCYTFATNLFNNKRLWKDPFAITDFLKTVRMKRFSA